MWCIPKVDEEFIKRMENILALYEKPYDPNEPVICFDETSKQLLSDTRARIPCREGIPAKRDYEYRRNGTRNIFMAVEPRGGYRKVSITPRRTRQDFTREIERIVGLPRYRNATAIHFVLDNLNTGYAG